MELKMNMYDLIRILEYFNLMYIYEDTGKHSTIKPEDRIRFENLVKRIMSKYNLTNNNHTTLEQLKILKKLKDRNFKYTIK